MSGDRATCDWGNTLVAVRRIGTIFGTLLVLSGAVWMLQGMSVGFAPKSFMTGSTAWVIYGAIALVSGLALIRRSRN